MVSTTDIGQTMTIRTQKISMSKQYSMTTHVRKALLSSVAILILNLLFVSNSFSQTSTCSGATTITPVFATSCTPSTAFNISGVGTGPAYSSCSTNTSSTNAWGQFTAAATITTISYTSINDAMIFAYSGTCGGTLSQIGCVDNGSSGLENLTLSGLTPGATYFFRIVRYNSTNSMSGSICISSPIPTITTSAISGSTFCAGSAISIPYVVSGPFSAGNVFTAQLSNVSGTFTSTTDIGTLNSSTSGTISATIPAGQAAGTLYKVRVISSLPAQTGTASSSILTINALPAQPSTITGSIVPCLGSSQVYSVTSVGGVTYNWTFPNGWNQTNGGTSNSVTVTVGSESGNVQVTPSNTCGDGSVRVLGVTASAPSTPSSSNTTICTETTANLTASGAASGDKYKWYDVANGGTPLKTSLNNTDNNYTTSSLTITTNYWVSIISASNCESTRTQVTVNVSSPAALVINQTNITCYAANNGTITVAASGGVSPYTFSVDGDNPTPTWLPATGTDLRLFTGLLPNTAYRIKVKDFNGCLSK